MKKLLLIFAMITCCYSYGQQVISNPCVGFVVTSQNNCPKLLRTTDNVTIVSGFKSAYITVMSRQADADSVVRIISRINNVPDTVYLPPIYGTSKAFGNVNFLPYVDSLFILSRSDTIDYQVTY